MGWVVVVTSTVATGAVAAGAAMVAGSGAGTGSGSWAGALVVSIVCEAGGIAEARVAVVAGGSAIVDSVDVGWGDWRETASGADTATGSGSGVLSG